MHYMSQRDNLPRGGTTGHPTVLIKNDEIPLHSGHLFGTGIEW